MPSCDLLSIGELFESLLDVQTTDLISVFLDGSGVDWHDLPDGHARRFVKRFSVKIVALGGVPFVSTNGGELALATSPTLPFDPESYRRGIKNMMAYSGMMSYLNSGRLSADEISRAMAEKGHGSVAHTVQVSLLVSGVTTAVENEFNSQRDLVHLSRVTVARTAIQSAPPIVVRDHAMLEAFRRIAEVADAERQSLSGQGRDFQEVSNQLFPVAKATAFIMTGTLRNLYRLTSARDDDGKEREFRDVLSAVDEILNGLVGSENQSE